MRYAGGLAQLRAGVDGIAINEQWLYFGALSGSGLYRIPLDRLVDPNSSDADLAAAVERHSDKPLSDGLSIDTAGTVYVTDIEHGAVFRIAENGKSETLLRTQKIRWADALSFGPDGWLYVADSALSDVILKSPEHIKTQGPYKIFRLQTGAEGTPGQ